MTDAAPKLNPVDLVIASAGTGKTTCLIEEIERAIHEKIDPTAILATTFTNKAAAELIERTRGRLLRPPRAIALRMHVVPFQDLIQHRILGDPRPHKAILPRGLPSAARKLCRSSKGQPGRVTQSLCF